MFKKKWKSVREKSGRRSFLQLIKNSLKFHDFSNIPLELLEKDVGLDANNKN